MAPTARERIESMKDDAHNALEELESEAWVLHNAVRDVRVAVHRLFAAQHDYGNVQQ